MTEQLSLYRGLRRLDSQQCPAPLNRCKHKCITKRKHQRKPIPLLTGASYTLEYTWQKNNPDFDQRNTIMIQYRENDIMDVLNIVLGFSADLDDDSGQLYGNLEYLAGDHTQFFINTTVNSGEEDNEF